MVLLPLIYIGLIAAAGYLVYLHATVNTGILSGRGNMTGRVLFYLAPIVVGGLLVLFMIKPLFARAAKQPAADPARSPALPAAVRVRRAHPPVRARARAARIRVDCKVNASAGLETRVAEPGQEATWCSRSACRWSAA